LNLKYNAISVPEEKWEKMLRSGLSVYSGTEKLRRRLKRGIPESLRFSAYQQLLLADTDDSINDFDFITESQKENKFTQIIKNDVPRTFTSSNDHSLSAADQRILFLVLNCYANLNPDLGYCQGMNLIAGTFIFIKSKSNNELLSPKQTGTTLNKSPQKSPTMKSSALLNLPSRPSKLADSPEEDQFKAAKETFLIFSAFISKLNLKGFYQENFPLLGQYVEKFSTSFALEAPEVKKHFDRLNVEPSIYVYQWFLCLFVSILPLDSVLIIWDSLIIEGLPFLVQIAVGLLKVLGEVLVKLDFEGILKFFKTMKIQDHEEFDAKLIGKLLVKCGNSITK
jgi:Rab-GTPase-TBC domain